MESLIFEEREELMSPAEGAEILISDSLRAGTVYVVSESGNFEPGN